MSARRIVDARLHLLSRQLLDADGEPVTTVDDLELVGADGDDAVAGRPVRIGAVLTGPVLLTRILRGSPPPSRWLRVPWDVVGSVGVSVHLTVPADSLDLGWTERWLREHLIGRIPGGSHDPEADQ